MIIGIGSDLFDSRRLEAVIKRQGQRFLDRVFTPHEQERAKDRGHPEQDHDLGDLRTYAKIFAAKEAVVKALGTGVANGVSWQHIEIQRQPWSPPMVVLSDAALESFSKRIPEGQKGIIHLTLTDEPPYCLAFVLLSAG